MTVIRRTTTLRAAAFVSLFVLASAGCSRQARVDERFELAGAKRNAFIESDITTVPRALTRPSRRSVAADVIDSFDTDRAMADAVEITKLGVRPGGSEAESSAAGYIDGQLRAAGLKPRIEKFRLPNGKTSRNVIAVISGTDSKRDVIVGAHFDTKPPSPGANDNASGCGVALELARQLKRNPVSANVKLIFFGTEEFLVDAPGDNHHLGSRFAAKRMTSAETRNTAGMLSVDMVGYGEKAYVRNMKRAPQGFAESLLSEAARQGVELTSRKDPGKTGWSDHEPFERRGIPAAWLEWLEDPFYHTAGDNGEHLQKGPMEVSGKLVLGALHALGPEELEELCKR